MLCNLQLSIKTVNSVQFNRSIVSDSLQHHELQHAKPPCPSSTLRACECVLVAQSCPTLCDPIDCSQPGSSIYGILQTRVLAWVAISFSIQLPVCVCLYVYVVPQSSLTLCDSRDGTHQALLSIGFFRQEYWSGFPFSFPYI